MDVAFPGSTNEDNPIEANRWEFKPQRKAPLTGTTLPEYTMKTAAGRGFRLAIEIYQAEGSKEASVLIL